LLTIDYLNGSFLVTGTDGLVLQSDPIVNLRLDPSGELQISGPTGQVCAIETAEEAAGPWKNFTNVVLATTPSLTHVGLGSTNRSRFFRGALLSSQ